MKRFMQIWVLMTAVIVISSIAVCAGTTDSGGGNQLMKNQTHWYQQAATIFGPVESLATKGGNVLTLQAGSAVYMNGNSTLHSYQMNAHALKGTAVLKAFADKDLLKVLQKGQVKALTLIVPVISFKSKESGLDDNAYKALNSKEYPEIEYKLTSETLKAGATDGTYVMTAPGTITVAGQSSPVTLSGDVTVKDNQVRFKGIQKLKFSDFKIKDPSASVLIVTITCADEFEVDYDVLFGKSAK